MPDRLSQRRITELDLVALDLEATGAAHGHDRIVEVGAVRFRIGPAGQVVPGEVFDALVDPELGIPEVVSRLTGIDDAMVAGAPRLDAVWGDLRTFLQQGAADGRQTVLLAHSAWSDLAYLVTETARLSLPMLPQPFVCTLQVARRALPAARRFSLEALRDYIASEPPPDATFHRAVADALHTRNLFAHCVREAEARVLADLGVREAEPVPRAADFRIEPPARLHGLVEAIAARRRLWITYGGGSKGRKSRPITPLAFYASHGAATLRAWCHLDDAAKSFRCDRILEVGNDDAPTG